MQIIQKIEGARLSGKSINFDVDFFKNFEEVQGRVMMKLINYNRNINQLQNMPHRRVKDLAIVYYCLVKDKISNGIIMIKNEHISMWNITEDELHDAAIANSVDYVTFNLMEALEGMFGTCTTEMRDDEEDVFSNLKILTNKEKNFGAATIMYPGVLSALSRMFKKNYYILPSSVHELILVKDDGDHFDRDKANELYEMVKYVNLTEVETEDVLSDNVYYYDRADDSLYDLNSCNELVMK
jgi:hypothetical protein